MDASNCIVYWDNDKTLLGDFFTFWVLACVSFCFILAVHFLICSFLYLSFSRFPYPFLFATFRSHCPRLSLKHIYWWSLPHEWILSTISSIYPPSEWMSSSRSRKEWTGKKKKVSEKTFNLWGVNYWKYFILWDTFKKVD